MRNATAEQQPFHAPTRQSSIISIVDHTLDSRFQVNT